MSLRGGAKLAGVDPALVLFAAEVGGLFDVRVTSGLRTDAEQLALWSKGRNGDPGQIVTNARTAESSAHGRGAAIDLVPLDEEGRPVWLDSDPRWQIIGTLAERMGLEWGGRWGKFRDMPHVQLKDWRRLPYPPESKGA